MYRVASISFSQHQRNFFCFPLFSEEHLNPQIRSCFYKLIRALSLIINFVVFSQKPISPTMVGVNFQIWKILFRHFYSCPPVKTLPEALSSPPRKGKLLFSPGSVFGEICFHQQIRECRLWFILSKCSQKTRGWLRVLDYLYFA